MEIIINNPFRILGLPVTATDRQISKRVDDLSMFCEMGKIKQYDTDFPFATPLQRTLDSIQRAASQLELPAQKLFHSIFWFWSGNSIDELVFELLKDGNTKKAKEIWEKPVSNGNLTAKNFPNCRNLALLNMVLSVETGDINEGEFLGAIRLFVNTFNHDSFPEFLGTIGGATCNFNVEDIQKAFADEALKILGKVDGSEQGVAAQRFIAAFDEAPTQIIQYVRSKYTNEPVRRLESAILECQESKQKDKSAIYSCASTLYSSAKVMLNNLEAILSKQDMHYQFIADKVATELLSCSTEYFNAAFESDNSSTPFDQAEKITRWAEEVAVGSSVKSKVEEDLAQINELRKQKPIEELVGQISDQFEKLPKLDNVTESQVRQLPQILRVFIDNSKRILSSMREIGGAQHEGYLTISNYVAGAVLGLSIEYANRTDNFRSVVEFLNDIKMLEMDADLRSRFTQNHAILAKNLVVEANNKSSGGCYIATLVYGSYEAPEVLILRKFRDEVMARSFIGMLFVHVYYAISPSLVVLLRNQITIQNIIRQLLNKIIGKIA